MNTPSKKYRIIVFISGACDQKLYGEKLERLEPKAIKLLTEHQPGDGGLRPDRYEVAEHVRQLSGNSAEWKTVKTVAYKEIPENQQEWRRRKAEREAKLEAKLAEERANQCKCQSPLTGQLCTMAKGHAGPHQVGGPYHTIESFITQCPEGQCEYHFNQTNNIHSLVRWQECVQCGHRKPLHVDQYLLETPLGAVELFATSDEEAIEFAMKHLAQTRVTVIPGIPNKLFAGLKLFRYPMNYVDKPRGYQGQTGGLIEVAPFISALSTTRHL